MNGRTRPEGTATKMAQSPTTSAALPMQRELNLVDDIGNYLMAYARQRPDVAAMCCFGVGFVLGWKLKPW